MSFEKSLQISIILATPPGFNAGMLVTELGLVAFLKRHNFLPHAHFYRLLEFEDRLKGLAENDLKDLGRRVSIGIASKSAVEEYGSIIESDAILYWADFLHMAQYLRALQNVCSWHFSDEKAAGLPEKIFLLSEASDETLSKTLTFATTMLFNTIEDDLSPGYAKNINRFLTNVRRVWVRDALSASRVSHIRQDYRTGYFGVDAALLLRREDLVEDTALITSPPVTLIFFGRDPSLYDKLQTLALHLATARGSSLEWLPWGDNRAFPFLGPRTSQLAIDEGATIYELLGALKRATLVVTDTYHLAVTAWNFGVPAICTFQGQGGALPDVSAGRPFNWRDKRELFFSQYDALDFMIRPEETSDMTLLDRRTEHILAQLKNKVLIDSIIQRIHAHAKYAEEDLATELRSLMHREDPL